MELNKEERLLRDALSQIETPEYDMEGAIMSTLGQKAVSRRYRLPRAVLVAAVLIAALAIGAAAVGISGLWERFFPNPVPQNAITTIGVSQTAGDYTLTLEDAVAGNDSVLILMGLSRADGQPIDPAARLQTATMDSHLLVDGKESGSSGYDGETLSEDGKTLYFCYAPEVLDKDIDLASSTLGFTADGVAIQIFSPDSFGYTPEETVDLSVFANIVVPDFSDLGEHWQREDHPAIGDALTDMNLHLPLPLDSEFPEYSLRGVIMTPDGLAFGINQGRVRNGDRACRDVSPLSLIDTRDGTRYSLGHGTNVEMPDGSNVFLTMFQDCPLTAADLPYLRLEVYYSIDQILSDAPFSLTFTPSSGASTTVPLECGVTVKGEDIHLTKLRFSTLSLSLDMTNGVNASNLFGWDGMGPVITMKDGSTIQAYRWGGSGSDAGPSTTEFRPYKVGNDRVFLDTDQIASISLNGVTLWTTGEYILTVEDSMADDDGVILLLSLRRADGGAVDPDASLRSNTIGCALLAGGVSIGSGFQPSVLSEDGKTLYLCMESWTDGSFESITGKTLTFKTGGVGIPILAGDAFPGRNLTVALSHPLPLSTEFPSFRFVESKATDDGFTVTTTLGRDVYGEFTAIKASPVTLTDTRDGKEYWSTQGEYLTLPDGTPAYRALYKDCSLTEADIPYLQATYGYTMDRVLSDAPASFSFTLAGGSGHLLPMDRTVNVSGHEVHLTELRFSSIGLSLNMSSGTAACSALLEEGAGPVLKMKNGSTVATSFRGSGSNPDGPSSISYTYESTEGQRVFPDVTQIISISLGGTTIWTAP